MNGSPLALSALATFEKHLLMLDQPFEQHTSIPVSERYALRKRLSWMLTCTSSATFSCSLGAAAVISILLYASAYPEKTGTSMLSENITSVFLHPCTRMTVQQGNKSVCFYGTLPDCTLREVQHFKLRSHFATCHVIAH